MKVIGASSMTCCLGLMMMSARWRRSSLRELGTLGLTIPDLDDEKLVAALTCHEMYYPPYATVYV